MKRLSVVLGAAMGFVAGGWCAEMPTNTWIAASGGAWEVASNWSDPSLVTGGAAFFAVFTNEAADASSPFAVTTESSPRVYGICYAPQTTSSANYMSLGGFTYVPHESFEGKARLDVVKNATLTLTAPVTRGDETAVIKKFSTGVVMFASEEPSFISIDIREGSIKPATRLALAGTELSTVYAYRGDLDLVCDAVVRDIPVSTARTKGVYLNGYELALGGYPDVRYRQFDSYAGKGTLAVQNGASLGLFRVQTGATDVALAIRNADLGLHNCFFGTYSFNDSVSGYTSLQGARFACYTFDNPDAPWANAFEPGLASLVPGEGGAPEIQMDAERGRVAYFDGTTSLVGPGENGVLDNMPSGSTAIYTIAFWMKVAPDWDWTEKSGLYAWGNTTKIYQCAQLYVKKADAAGAFVVTHFGSSMTVSNDVVGAAFDGAWHHVAVVRKGGQDAFWLDGALVQKASASEGLAEGAFSLGRGTGSFGIGGFRGWIDDFTIIGGKDADPGVVKDAEFALRPIFNTFAPTVRYEGGGTLASNGGQDLAGLEGDGVTGALKLLGDQSLVGTGAARTFSWRGSVTGRGDLVKKGAETTQALFGPQRFTGDLRVEEGVLSLSPLDSTNAASSCVAHWTFDDAENVGYDASGTGFALKAADASGVSVETDETRGPVLRLKGSYLVSSGNAPASFPTGASPYTIMLWMKPEAGTANSSVWCLGDTAHGACDYFRLDGLTGVMFTNWGNNQQVAGANCRDGAWHHVAKVYDGVTMTLYLDGRAVGSIAATPDIASAPFYLGYRKGDTAASFTGCLDDVRVYTAALSSEEIAADGESAFPEPLARWTFDDAAAPYASVGAGGGFTLAAQGAAAVSTTDDQRSGGVLDLTGGAGSCLKAEAIPDWMPANGSFTLAFWVRPRSGSGANPYLWYGGSAADAAGCLVAPRNDVLFRFAYGAGNALDLSRLPFSAGASNKWTHVTCVYDATAKTMRIYFDGACVAEKTGVEDAAIPRESLFLGCGNDPEGGCFDGWLDDVCVWAKALRSSWVRAHCAAGAGRLDRPLLEAQTGIAVSSGATFSLGNGADATAATLTGEGTVHLGAGSCLTLAGGGTFDGTLSGAGALALSGGTFARSDGSALALDLAIADGASFSTDANGTGLPAAITTGTLTLPANGTVVFDCARDAVLGRTFTIARGGSVSAPAGLDGWKVVCADKKVNCKATFAIKGGAFTVTVTMPGLALTIR